MGTDTEADDENFMSNTAPIDSIQRTHREALTLAEQARNYIACRGPALRRALPVDGQAIYAAESMRMSSRIIHVIAWTLTQKAVAAGELARDEASDPEWRLGGEAVCLAEPMGDLELLPEPGDGSTGSGTECGRRYFFSVKDPKRFWKRATWPPLSMIRWAPPVQAGCDLGSISSVSVSPSLPHVE